MNKSLAMSNNSRICLLCLIGLPAAGKSYLASLISKLNTGFSEVLHVCYDELIKWDINDIIWKEKRKYVYDFVEEKISSFTTECQSKSLLIILDDNMYYCSMRYEFYKLARKWRIKFCQVYLDIPVEICLERNFNRDPTLPTHLILNMNEKLERPSLNNHWEKDTLTLNQSVNIENSLSLIKSMISSSKVPELEKIAERDQSQSVKHTADIALRKIVSLLVKEIKNSSPHDISGKVSAINRRRKEIYNTVLNGELHLPNEHYLEIYIQYFIPLFGKEVQ